MNLRADATALLATLATLATGCGPARLEIETTIDGSPVTTPALFDCLKVTWSAPGEEHEGRVVSGGEAAGGAPLIDRVPYTTEVSFALQAAISGQPYCDVYDEPVVVRDLVRARAPLVFDLLPDTHPAYECDLAAPPPCP